MGMSWAYGAAERDDAQSREVLRGRSTSASR
jgi:hypothetical protein